jgi:hypothetical protein
MCVGKFRYVAVAPGRIEEHRAIGKAHALHDFLVDHQTHPDGRVHYGRAISYAWIRSKWKASPCQRTLERHMAKLKAARLVMVRKLPHNAGMRVTVLRSAKWPAEPAQSNLFPSVDILWIRSGNPVNAGSPGPDRSVGTAPTEVSGKSSKNQSEEKTNSNSARFARSAAEAAALADRRRLLKEQARMVMAKYKTAG